MVGCGGMTCVVMVVCWWCDGRCAGGVMVVWWCDGGVMVNGEVGGTPELEFQPGAGGYTLNSDIGE